MTREEILEIDQYCQEHKMSYRKRLDELHIPFWNFYKAKRKYRLEDESSTSRGEFVQLVADFGDDHPGISAITTHLS